MTIILRAFCVYGQIARVWHSHFHDKYLRRILRARHMTASTVGPESPPDRAAADRSAHRIIQAEPHERSCLWKPFVESELEG